MTSLLLLGLLAQAPAAPAAPVLPRADVYAVVGWQNLHKEQPQDHYNDWLNAIIYGGAGAGWMWNDHLRTQVDVGAGTKDDQYRYSQAVVNGSDTFQSSRLFVRESSVSVAQQYQFFRNQWFHPRVGAGVELARETRTEEFQPLLLYDNVSRTSRVVSPARTEGPDHRFITRGFADTGFKAYMTRTAFFTGDMRVMFRDGIDEVLFRAGFGFDF